MLTIANFGATEDLLQGVTVIILAEFAFHLSISHGFGALFHLNLTGELLRSCCPR